MSQVSLHNSERILLWWVGNTSFIHSSKQWADPSVVCVKTSLNSVDPSLKWVELICWVGGAYCVSGFLGVAYCGSLKRFHLAQLANPRPNRIVYYAVNAVLRHRWFTFSLDNGVPTFAPMCSNFCYVLVPYMGNKQLMPHNVVDYQGTSHQRKCQGLLLTLVISQCVRCPSSLVHSNLVYFYIRFPDLGLRERTPFIVVVT